jgi:hypothetical protein
MPSGRSGQFQIAWDPSRTQDVYSAAIINNRHHLGNRQLPQRHLKQLTSSRMRLEVLGQRRRSHQYHLIPFRDSAGTA